MEGKTMSIAKQCKFFGHFITIEKALAIKDATPVEKRKSLGFECATCGKPVRPYNAGDRCPAHFVHLIRNPDCRFIDPPRFA
jgi:hypothetical protein